MKTKKLTLNWLMKHGACMSAIRAFKKSNMDDLFQILNALIKSNEVEKFEWASWLIVRKMNKKQKVQYAVFAAELVINIFEKKHPNDSRPRTAILAAKKYISNPSEKTKNAAAYAANAAAYAATNAAYAAANAAYAANAAANTAVDAVDAAYAANAATNAAVDDAVDDAVDAYNKILIKILKYGIKLLKS